MNFEIFSILAISILILVSLVLILLAASLILRDVSIVDYCWGAAFVIIFWILAYSYLEFSWRALIFGLMLSFWGIRLSVFLFWRNLGKGEDRRYKAIREYFGDNFTYQALMVFSTQAALILLLSGPIYITIMYPEYPLSWLELLAILLWIIGFSFEVVADFQLWSFKSDLNNKGKVLDTGLWKYSRHPNYFGEAVLWFGYGLYVFSVPIWGWYGIICSIIMLYLLLRVSGVGLLDEAMLDKYPEEYRNYIRNTPSFIPFIL